MGVVRARPHLFTGWEDSAGLSFESFMALQPIISRVTWAGPDVARRAPLATNGPTL